LQGFSLRRHETIRAARSQAHHQRGDVDTFIIPPTSRGEQEALRLDEGGKMKDESCRLRRRVSIWKGGAEDADRFGTDSELDFPPPREEP